MIIKTGVVKRALSYFGRKVNSPEQRLMLGATALLTQPLIDLTNKNVDKETRKTSVARTLAKIAAGTLVGYFVRVGGIKLVKNYSKFIPAFNNVGKFSGAVPKTKKDIFLPVFKDPKLVPKSQELFEKELASYQKSMGTLLATVAMVFTNFALDAPLTKLFTNFFIRKIDKNFDKAFEDYQKSEGQNESS